MWFTAESRRVEMAEYPIIAGLDVGNEANRVLIGEMKPNGALQFLGWGSHLSGGIHQGAIVNIEAFQNSIEIAVENAEQEAGRTVREISLALGGSLLDSFNSRGVVPISGKNRAVGPPDIERVHQSAAAVAIPLDQDILHILPRTYTIDHQCGIRNPLNMMGVRLETEVHIVTVLASAVDNMRKAFERVDYKIQGMHSGVLAASYAVLSQDEKEMGALLIDIGAMATDFILVQNGSPKLTGSIPVGGYYATSDLSYVLRISMEAAERFKQELACCWPELAAADEPILVPRIGGLDSVFIQRSKFAEILESRMRELFCLIRNKVDGLPGGNRLAGGLVLTGGGSLLSGAAELARQVFAAPVRVGGAKAALDLPKFCRDPRWSTAAGLIQMEAAAVTGGSREESTDNAENPKLLKGLQRWFGQFF